MHPQPQHRSTLADIHEFNLGFLMLARKLATQGTQTEKAALGLEPSSCELIASMTDEQLTRLARSSMVMGHFALNDHALLSTLNAGRDSGVLALAQAVLAAELEN